MNRISNIPRNKLAGSLADNLISAKKYANQYEVKPWVPVLGGTGLGDMFMGEAPELADDASYYGLKALYKGGNLATGGMGTYAPDRRTFDAAVLGLDAGGLGKGLGYLGKTAANKVLSGPYLESRRDFVKKTGALSAAAALGAGGLGAFRSLGKKAGDNTLATAGKHKFNSLAEYMEDVTQRWAKKRVEVLNQIRQAEEQYYAAGEYPPDMDWKLDMVLPDTLANDERAYKALKAGKVPPEPSSYGNTSYSPKLDDFSPKAKEEMKQLKRTISDRSRSWEGWEETYARDLEYPEYERQMEVWKQNKSPLFKGPLKEIGNYPDIPF